MSMAAGLVRFSRAQTLRALGVTPLRLCTRTATAASVAVGETAAAQSNADEVRIAPIDNGRIAMAPSHEELNNPTLAALYTRIGEAISSLGLQCVRIADAEADAGVRVLVFGDRALPSSIDGSRVVRVDPLSVLHADRERKRALWTMLRTLLRKPGSA